jgi:anti-sigma regulatory factor (Ser/Thr protein kinase)
MLWLCDIRLAAVVSDVRKARNLVDALGMTLPVELRDDLRLLISEVVTNAVRHGTPAGDGSPIRIRIGLDGQRMRVEVHDRGAGFEHAPRGPGSELGSGWGVHFVDELTDCWGAGRHADAWVVWFEVCLPRHHDEGAPLGRERMLHDFADFTPTA